MLEVDLDQLEHVATRVRHIKALGLLVASGGALEDLPTDTLISVGELVASLATEIEMDLGDVDPFVPPRAERPECEHTVRVGYCLEET